MLLVALYTRRTCMLWCLHDQSQEMKSTLLYTINGVGILIRYVRSAVCPK